MALLGPAPMMRPESATATIRRTTGMTSPVIGQLIGTMKTVQSGIVSLLSKARIDTVQTSVMSVGTDQAVAAGLQAEPQARTIRGIGTHQI